MDALAQLVALTQETRQSKSDIHGIRQKVKKMQREIKGINAALQHLAYEIQRSRQNETHEREALTLRLKNVLLKFERRLPPGKSETEQEYL